MSDKSRSKPISSKLPRFGKKEISTFANNPLYSYYPIYGGETSRLVTTDELLATAGGDSWRRLDIYIDLLTDAHCFAMWDKQMTTITSREIEVTPVSTLSSDVEVADFVRDIIENIGFADELEKDGIALTNNDLSLNNLERSMLFGLITGYSFAEVIWKVAKNKQIVPQMIKYQDPRRLDFYGKDTGEIYPKLITRKNSTDGIYLPSRKFILFQYWSVPTETPEGFGLGRFLYFPVLWKREVLTYWMRVVDKHHDPTRIGIYPLDAPDNQVQDFFNAVQRVANDSVLLMPEGFQINWQDPGASGAVSILKELLDYCDRQISLILLGETTTGESLSGNVASEGINDNIRLSKAKSWDEDFLATLRSTLIKWAVEINYPGRAIPKISRKWKATETKDVLMSRIFTLESLGLKVDRDFIKEKIGIPFTEEQEQEQEQEQAVE